MWTLRELLLQCWWLAAGSKGAVRRNWPRLAGPAQQHQQQQQ
jgi:hypothetical protein